MRALRSTPLAVAAIAAVGIFTATVCPCGLRELGVARAAAEPDDCCHSGAAGVRAEQVASPELGAPLAVAQSFCGKYSKQGEADPPSLDLRPVLHLVQVLAAPGAAAEPSTFNPSEPDGEAPPGPAPPVQFLRTQRLLI